jgi:hypothetical protein
MGRAGLEGDRQGGRPGPPKCRGPIPRYTLQYFHIAKGKSYTPLNAALRACAAHPSWRTCHGGLGPFSEEARFRVRVVVIFLDAGDGDDGGTPETEARMSRTTKPPTLWPGHGGGGGASPGT